VTSINLAGLSKIPKPGLAEAKFPYLHASFEYLITPHVTKLRFVLLVHAERDNEVNTSPHNP